MTTDTTAILAQGYAALHQLGQITITVGDLEVPAIIDRETQTVHIQSGLDLEHFILLLKSGVEALCNGKIVVERDDGEGTEWATAVGETSSAISAAPQPRPMLRLV